METFSSVLSMWPTRSKSKHQIPKINCPSLPRCNKTWCHMHSKSFCATHSSSTFPTKLTSIMCNITKKLCKWRHTCALLHLISGHIFYTKCIFLQCSCYYVVIAHDLSWYSRYFVVVEHELSWYTRDCKKSLWHGQQLRTRQTASSNTGPACGIQRRGCERDLCCLSPAHVLDGNKKHVQE